MGNAREIANLLAMSVAPTLGMAMVWPLLRYASFFMLLYPAGLEVPFGERGLSAHGVFLATLAVAAMGALALWRRMPGAFCSRTLVAAMGLLPAVGAFLALAANKALLPSWFLWISIVVTAVGFLVLYVAWGSYMAGLVSSGEALRAIVLLGLSLALSFLLFSRAGLVGKMAGGQVAAIIMPLGASILWFCSRPVTSLAAAGERCPLRQAAAPLVLAVGMFLVVGSTVRGIVDLQSQGMPGRQFSMEASLVVAAVAVVVAVCAWMSGQRSTRSENDTMMLLAVGYWMAFALLFLAGLFVFLSTNHKQEGGDVVVVSRTLMELVFWLLLCHTVAERHLPAVPVFLTCGLLIEVISWAVSYVLIPILANTASTSAMLRDNSFVLAVVLSAVAVGLMGMGIRLTFRRPIAAEDIQTAGSSMESAAESMVSPSKETLGKGLLTEREASVAHLYAHGYSLQKVADELHITKSTAQSHIKHVYRKLGVHSRDELIEVLGDEAVRHSG